MTNSDTLTMGIDEAGRGPVLGPMVLAGVVLDNAGARALSQAGLVDSKSYGSGNKAKAKRSALACQVFAYAKFVSVQIVDVAEVDRRVRRSELNILEREVADTMISAAPAVDRIIADGYRLFAELQTKYPHLEALNNGESEHTSVAAASVIAKTRRDDLFAIIQRRYLREFGVLGGGGYVNSSTKSYLRAYALAHGRLPPEARRSWPFVYLTDILGTNLCPEPRCEDRSSIQLDLFPTQPTGQKQNSSRQRER